MKQDKVSWETDSRFSRLARQAMLLAAVVVLALGARRLNGNEPR